MTDTIKIKVPGLALTERDTVAEGTRARACFEVLAGVIPGQPMPEYTRRWIITEEAWEKDLADTKEVRSLSREEFEAWVKAGNKVTTTFISFRDQAYDYAKSIINPEYVNWVRVDFLWL